jgi:hypothetical protein
VSQHTITRIANVLEKQFQGLIDMSDYDGRPADPARTKFLTRALAALCIKNLSGADPVTAAAAVTDDFQTEDRTRSISTNGQTHCSWFKPNGASPGISPWTARRQDPSSRVLRRSFISGVEDLLDTKFDRFNKRIRRKEAEVRAALYSERPIKLRLVTAHTAEQPTPTFVQRKIDDLMSNLTILCPLPKRTI